MYSIRKSFLVFCKQAKRARAVFAEIHAARHSAYKEYVFATGALNALWQAWGDFWRVFWLAHFVGGYDFKKNRLALLHPCGSDARAVAHVLSLLGRPIRRPIRYRSQEPTWGDVTIIQTVATRYNAVGQPGSVIAGAFSALGNAPAHMQKVRNAAIHLNKETMLDIKRICNYYVVPATIKYPTELMFSLEMRSGNWVYQNWEEDLTAFLELVLVQ